MARKTHTERLQMSGPPFDTATQPLQADPKYWLGFALPSNQAAQDALKRSGLPAHELSGSLEVISVSAHRPAEPSVCFPHSAKENRAENCSPARVVVHHVAGIGTWLCYVCCKAVPPKTNQLLPIGVAVKPKSKLPPCGGRVLHYEGCPAAGP